MSLVAIILMIFFFFGFIITAYLSIPPFQQMIKKLIGNSSIERATIVIAIATIFLVCFMLVNLLRAGSLFVGQNRPLIDVTPKLILYDPKNGQTMTTFSISNYSGFKAYKVGIDLRYHEKYSWILEWRKAENDRLNKKKNGGVEGDKFYELRTKIKIPEIGPGETINPDEPNKYLSIKGTLNLEDDVCNKGNKGYPVLVRTTWENYLGHVFDAVHKYKLICTKVVKENDPKEGRAFTMIPQGVVSQKDIGIVMSEDTKKE